MLRLAFVRLTSCSGCQLTLLNAEEALALLPATVIVRRFPLLGPTGGEGPLDLALVEGSVSRPEELAELLTLRRQARVLVAVGACAVNGGVNVLAGAERARLAAAVYGSAAAAREAFLPQPLARLVKVDYRLHGCPVEQEELLQLLGALARGGVPAQPENPLCLECRLRENLCLLLEQGLPCLGPVTRSGCRVHCPSRGIPCEGCRGRAVEANLAEMERLLLEVGLAPREIRARLERFGGYGDAGGAD